MTGTLGHRLQTGRWDVVNSLSSAGFAVRNLGVKTVRGTVPIRDAAVEVDAAGLPVSVRATLDLTGIYTGNARRDRDLAKPNLLGTKQHPTLTFRSTALAMHDTGWTVTGPLHAHGCSVEVALEVVGSETPDPRQVTVRATTSFDRRELGIRAPRFMIGTRIEVTVDAVLSRART